MGPASISIVAGRIVVLYSIRRTNLLFHSVRAKLLSRNLYMPGVCLWLLVALHRLQNFEPHVGARACEVLPSVYEPLERADE